MLCQTGQATASILNVFPDSVEQSIRDEYHKLTRW